MSRPANKKEEILQHAVSQFARCGFEGTTIRHIAGKCGITEAAIYRHYSSKRDLYNASIASKASQHNIREFLKTSDWSGEIEVVLAGLATYLLGLAKKDPELLRLISYASLEDAESRMHLYNEVRLPLIMFLSKQIEKRINSGELKPVDPWITGRCFVGMILDCAFNFSIWGGLEKEATAENVICNNIPIFARGLKNGHCIERGLV